ncbi:MAG: hypothetical protein ACW98F_08895 [Candidatus Hodarchaeales archaeon]|jgi:hypothetical protein
MGLKKNLLLSVLIIGFLVGLILFIDEIRIVPFLEGLTPFLDDIGFPERLLPDLSQFHIAGVHHWMFGVLLMLGCCLGLIYTIKNVESYDYFS